MIWPSSHAAKSGRTPPLHIPLDFDTAVGGLLKVAPKEPVKSVRKKPAKKGRKK
jgi:hypothetical protein